MAAGRILMMGPGRWGSSNIELGVNVTYADINNTAVLVEMAREEAGQVPEVSYGTHFFLDLVEAQIIYLPVYPSDPEAEFNGEIFERLPNVLTDLLPDAERFREIIRVFDLPAATGGSMPMSWPIRRASGRSVTWNERRSALLENGVTPSGKCYCNIISRPTGTHGQVR